MNWINFLSSVFLPVILTWGECAFQAELTKQQNTFKIVLKQLEDSLLARLSAASGNFLGDTALVENLETTKRTATEIEEKVRRLWLTLVDKWMSPPH